MSQKLILQDDHILGRGGLRVCYLHPQDPNLVIKLPVGGKTEEIKANISELKSFQALVAKHGQLPFISRCHGLVNTNRGEGLVCDCIRDASGAVSKTIWDLFTSGKKYDIDNIILLATDFCNFLQKNDVWLFDLNLQNLALQVQHGSSCRIIAIDLKGRFSNNEFIKISSYFDFFARRKVKRRCHQLLATLHSYKKEGEKG
ncbi:YrbL family protein [Desulfurivibrio sp. D14AmB]|uniref:YrbL family protein n=1 Tax=Desulfurivibrio sp. D14AmB TaxID=3374370 RepID=UPI00376EEA2F